LTQLRFPSSISWLYRSKKQKKKQVIKKIPRGGMEFTKIAKKNQAAMTRQKSQVHPPEE
jgi:hypothetical protein